MQTTDAKGTPTPPQPPPITLNPNPTNPLQLPKNPTINTPYHQKLASPPSIINTKKTVPSNLTRALTPRTVARFYNKLAPLLSTGLPLVIYTRSNSTHPKESTQIL